MGAIVAKVENGAAGREWGEGKGVEKREETKNSKNRTSIPDSMIQRGAAFH